MFTSQAHQERSTLRTDPGISEGDMRVTPVSHFSPPIFTKEYACGHRSRTFSFSLKIEAYGEQFTVRSESGLCPECAAKHILEKHCRCTICTKAILPGTYVFIVPTTEDRVLRFQKRRCHFKNGDHDSNLYALVCMRMGCLGTIGTSGFWDGEAYSSPDLGIKNAPTFLRLT